MDSTVLGLIPLCHCFSLHHIVMIPSHAVCIIDVAFHENMYSFGDFNSIACDRILARPPQVTLFIQVNMLNLLLRLLMSLQMMTLLLQTPTLSTPFGSLKSLYAMVMLVLQNIISPSLSLTSIYPVLIEFLL